MRAAVEPVPNRFIRESALTSATLYRLSDGAERLFWRMTLIADDYGRFEADPQVLKSKCFPRWPDAKMSLRRVANFYAEVEKAELVRSYAVAGAVYGYFVTWTKYQETRAKKSRYPEPTEASLLASANICSHLLTKAPVSVSVSVSESVSVSGNTSPALLESAHARNGQHMFAGSPPEWGSPEGLVALYNASVPADHPRVTQLSPARRDKARRYLVAFPERSFWEIVFEQINQSNFLRRGSKERPNFRGDFDWLLTRGKDNSENAVKVAEGKYNDKLDAVPAFRKDPRGLVNFVRKGTHETD